MKYQWVVVCLAVAFSGSWPVDSYAKSTKSPTAASTTLKKKTTTTSSKKTSYTPKVEYSALVVDADTGHVLYEKNAGNIRYPASLTKMMTLYLTFDALKRGKISLDEKLPVSKKAAEQPQTNISLNKGDKLPVRKAIESLVVRSANDSAMVIAEALGGTEFNFALMMTKKAHELGMKNTVFRNPSGLPDNKQHTTAYDMARMAIALRRDFPEYYHFFSLQDFDYNGTTYPGHNRVMARYDGVDGVKTGYIRASGFNLVTSVRKNGYNLVAVIIGAKTADGRDDEMIALLDRSFAQLGTRKNSIAGSHYENETNASQHKTIKIQYTNAISDNRS